MGDFDDGGDAFPPGIAVGPSDDAVSSHGMSLRDWFAGNIAAGMAAHSGTAGMDYGPGEIARRSYEVADALLSARWDGGGK